VIHTVNLEGRPVTVSLKPGQRIVEVGDEFYLEVGEVQHPVLWMRVDETNARIAEMLVQRKPEASA